MKGLRCTTTNCEHNHACHCDAGVINISKSAVCTTKQKRNMGTLGQAFEAASDFDRLNDDNTFVQCDSVDCVYNKHRLCCAQAITVSDGKIRTKCFSKRTD